MQSRTHEEFAKDSSYMKSRTSNRGNKLGCDPYSVPRREVLDRSPRHHSRNLSSPWRDAVGERRRRSLERREYCVYGQRVGSRSRSPRFGEVFRRQIYEERVLNRGDELRRKYEFCDYFDRNNDLMDERGTDRRSFRGSRGDDVEGEGVLRAGRHWGAGRDSINEDGVGRVGYRLSGDFGSTTRYSEEGVKFPLSSSSMNLGTERFPREKALYPDPLLHYNLSAVDSSGNEEKPAHYSNDVEYSSVLTHHSNNLRPNPQLKDYASNATGTSRGNYMMPFCDGMVLPTENHPRKVKEPPHFSIYGKRHLWDAERIPEGGKDLPRHQWDTISPYRELDPEHLYPKHGVRKVEGYSYSSEGMYRRTDVHERDNTESNECSRRISNNYHSSEDELVSKYLSMNRSSTASKQGIYLEYESAHVQLGSKRPENLGVSEDGDISRMRLNSDFERYSGSISGREIVTNSQERQPVMEEVYELEKIRKKMKLEEIGKYNPLDRPPMRKFDMDEKVGASFSPNIMSSKGNNLENGKYLDDINEKWTNRDANNLFPEILEYGDSQHERRGWIYDNEDYGSVYESGDWISYDSHIRRGQEPPTRLFKHGGKHWKDHPRPDLHNSCDLKQLNKKNRLSKNVWIRGIDDKKMDIHSNEAEMPASSRKPESSGTFKQLVNKYFLYFTKKLNENPATRRRYLELGRAGSLFCIACGRSMSKEFLDTQRLVTHCFMSKKIELRAQHLGLHRAICVLMGWNSEVVPDTTTFLPEGISSSEALAQREDLILWPPVVIIHNSSVQGKIPDADKVISKKVLEDFLRGKGFSSGKVKVCLGNPANHSVMVVKFLGTYYGLRDAEKLHEYFSEDKRGRTESTSKSKGGDMQREEAEDLVLYGYMGIAEDLDKVDADTKRNCSIKSKKEIQDFVNAPVKC